MKINMKTFSRVLSIIGIVLIVAALGLAFAGSFESYEDMVKSFEKLDKETGLPLATPTAAQSLLVALVSSAGTMILAGLVLIVIAVLLRLGLKEGSISIFNNTVLGVFSATCIFPLVWMFYSSLKEKRVFNADIMGIPTEPTLINYERILTNKDYHLAESMWNSVRTTGLSILMIVLFSFVV